MKNLKDSLNKKHLKFSAPDKNVSREFQIYGYELAERLGDQKHKALYMKLAKETPRDMLEQAYRFVADYSNPKSKGKLFMFKLKELKNNQKHV